MPSSETPSAETTMSGTTTAETPISKPSATAAPGARDTARHGSPPGVRGSMAIAVISAIALLLHVYPAWRLLTSSNVMSTTVAIVIGVAASAVFVGLMVAGHAGHFDRIGSIGDIWLGVIFQLFVWTVIGELLRLVLWAFDVADAGPLASIVIAVGTALVLAYGLYSALGPVPISRREITLPRLHPDLAGLRIVQISDTHLSSLNGRRWMTRIAQQADALKADIYCHTGDLADGNPKLRITAARELANVRGDHKYFITGNHEYFSDAPYWGARMSELGWQFLHNTHVVYRRGEGGLVIAGIDDPTGTASGIAGHGPHLDAALAGAAEDLPVLLLAHQPKQSADAAAHNVDLQLAGHTHGGQMWPFHYLVRADQKYVRGLHAINARTQLYVSRGTGFWGPPFRIGAAPEIALLTLRAGNPD